MFHVGFTGTSDLSPVSKKRQDDLARRLRALDRALGKCVLHHGDCVGADAYSHTIAFDLGWDIEVHPPSDSKKRAGCKVVRPSSRLTMHKPISYLNRNKNIVKRSDVLFALPNNPDDLELIDDPRYNRRLGGTWATVRFALKQNVNVIIV